MGFHHLRGLFGLVYLSGLGIGVDMEEGIILENIPEAFVRCKTRDWGVLSIKKGDAVRLIGPYVVSNQDTSYNSVLGQAMNDCDENDADVYIKVRGLVVFRADKYSRCDLEYGDYGVMMSLDPGVVRVTRRSKKTTGTVLKYENDIVHILL